MDIFKLNKIQHLNKSRLFSGVILISSPWLILFVFSIITGHLISESVPVWSDELAYWHEILSLSQKGLQHGYYTYNEVAPVLSSFGSHGFGTVTVYALFAQVFGWKTYSIVIANTFFMSLAFLFLFIMLKPTAKIICFVLLFTVSYSPYLLFSVTSMSEGLNYALLIVYFVFLYAFIQRDNMVLFLSLLAICTAFSLVRIIYIVLFLPVLFIRNKESKFDFKLLIYALFWLVFSAILFVVNGRFISPYPDSFLKELFSAIGITGKVSLFAVHFADNLLNFVNPFSDNLLQVLERYFTLVVLIYSLLKSGMMHSKQKKIEIRYFVVFLILFLVLLITFGAYDVFDWRDYRVLAPVLYGCVLYLILNANSFELSGLLAVNVLVLVFLIFTPQTCKLFSDGRYSKPLKNNVLARIKYTNNASNCFDNTLAVKSFNQQTVLSLPVGIGITTVDSLSDFLHSKYIYTEKKMDFKTYKLIDFDRWGYLYSKR